MDKTNVKPRLLFVYANKYTAYWRDGLWAALKLLENDYDISYLNLADPGDPTQYGEYDFHLGWGGVNSPAHKFLNHVDGKKGLCYAGNENIGTDYDDFDVFFYELDYFKDKLTHRNMIHAFGVNTDLMKPTNVPKIFDYLGVGALAAWKRWEKMLLKQGVRLVVGEFQKNNPQESGDIANFLITNGIGYMDMVMPEVLVSLYNASKTVYMPASNLGGGARTILEARACGCNVEIEPDNEIIRETLTCPVWDHHYYADQLRKGINACLR